MNILKEYKSITIAKQNKFRERLTVQREIHELEQNKKGLPAHVVKRQNK